MMPVEKNYLKRFILTCFLLAGTFNVFAKESAADLFSHGNLFFQKQEYDSAQKAFEDILQYDSAFADVWFNLGNVHFRKGEFAKAILCYERAKKLSPADEDIDFNLHITNLRTTDKIDPLPRIFYLRWIDAASFLFSANDWALIIVALFWLAVIFILCYFLIPSVAIRKLGFFLAAIALVVMAFSYALVLHQQNLIHGTERGIIMAASVYVKSSPDEKSSDLFILHEGTKVDVLDELNGWKKIRIANGSIGWVMQSTFEVI
jgi:tetratricopeptide (TPR) repeat protein